MAKRTDIYDKVPYVEISRSILWLIDKIRKTGKRGRDYEWLIIADIIDKSEVYYPNLNSYIKKHHDRGIEVLTSVFDPEKIRAIRISEDFEKHLRDSFKPYGDEEGDDTE